MPAAFDFLPFQTFVDSVFTQSVLQMIDFFCSQGHTVFTSSLCVEKSRNKKRIFRRRLQQGILCAEQYDSLIHEVHRKERS